MMCSGGFGGNVSGSTEGWRPAPKPFGRVQPGSVGSWGGLEWCCLRQQWALAWRASRSELFIARCNDRTGRHKDRQTMLVRIRKPLCAHVKNVDQGIRIKPCSLLCPRPRKASASPGLLYEKGEEYPQLARDCRNILQVKKETPATLEWCCPDGCIFIVFWKTHSSYLVTSL